MGDLFPSTREALSSRGRRKHGGSPTGLPLIPQPAAGGTAPAPTTPPQTEWNYPTNARTRDTERSFDWWGMDAEGQAAETLSPTEQAPTALQGPHFNAESAMSELNTASRNFTLFQALEGETLSPEARAQLDGLKEETRIQVTRLNDQINNYMRGQDSFQRLTQGHQGMVDESIATGRAAIESSRNATQQNIATIKGEGLTAVESATARAMDSAVAALPEVQAQDAYYNYVRGGTVSNEERARQEGEVTESMKEIDNLIASNISLNAQSQSTISNATARAADAQVNLMGITDRQQRLMTTTGLDNDLRQSVYNLVTQRQDLERNLARNEQALLNEERNRNEDKFGLGIDPTPQGMFYNTLAQELDAGTSALGVNLTPPQAEGVVKMFEAWSALMPGDPGRAAIEQQIGQLLKIDPARANGLLMDADRAATAVFNEVSNLGDRTSFTPGSPAMVSLLYQGGLQGNVPPELADQFANSSSMQELINMQSKGKVNASRGGNMLGLGGLSRETYKALGYEWDEIKEDPIAQAAALMAYVVQAYGDPAYALQQYMNTGEFGQLDLSDQEAIPPSGRQGGP